MAYNNGLITDSVSMYDVQQAIGSGSNDLATLCKSTNIKQWAKYRPMQYGTRHLGLLTDVQRASVNYGIGNIPAWGNAYISNIVDVWVFSSTDSAKLPDGYSTVPTDGWWTKNLPTDAYRLADFVCESDHTKGYFASADPPIGMIEQAANNSGKVTIQYKMNTAGVTAGLTTFYSDLTQMNNRSYKTLYFGICIVCGTSSSKTIYIATQNDQVGDIGDAYGLWAMGATVRFKTDSLSGAIYNYLNNGTPFYVFPILTSLKNYVENDYIRAASNQTIGTVIPLQPYESVTLQTFYVEGIIIDFYTRM